MTAKILAFDIGSHIACAHNLYGDDVRASHYDAEGDRIKRAAETQGWLSELFRQACGPEALVRPDVVVYERPFARGQAATRSLWGVVGLLEACAGAWGLPVIDYTPGEIKKFATGKGDASKDDMTFAAQLMGYDGENEHEADAWCALRFAEENINLTPTKGAKAWKQKKGKK